MLLSQPDTDEVVVFINFSLFVVRPYFERCCIICIHYCTYWTKINQIIIKILSCGMYHSNVG